MSASSWLNRHPRINRLWMPAFEFGYVCLKTAVAIFFGPIWRVRRVGRRAHVPSGGVVLCPNHASYLDPAFVQLVVRRRLIFVMTENFYRLSWGRWFFKLVGAVSIGSGRSARKGLRRSMALVRRGHAIVVFPEGRLTTDGHLNRAQRGIGRLARRAGVPVIPVGIAGARHAWGKGTGGPGKARVRVAFGRPIVWGGDPTLANRAAEQQFADRVMASIAETKAWVQAHSPDPRDFIVKADALQKP